MAMKSENNFYKNLKPMPYRAIYPYNHMHQSYIEVDKMRMYDQITIWNLQSRFPRDWISQSLQEQEQNSPQQAVLNISLH